MKKAARPQQEEARRLAAKGWSQTKIERSLAQSQKTRERHAELSSAGAAADLERWRGFVSEMLSAGLPYVGIVLHFYDGPIEARLDLKDRELVRVGPTVAEELATMREDARYDFRAEA